MSKTSTSPASFRRLRIFLCHSSEDKRIIRDLYRRLKTDGFEPWLDEEDLLPGQKWSREIRSAIRTCDVIAVCLSKGAVKKEGYIQKEIREALNRADEKPEGAIFVIPVRIEPVEIPENLREWQWADLFEEEGYAKLIRALQKQAQAVGMDLATPSSGSALEETTGPVSRQQDIVVKQLPLQETQSKGFFIYHADALALGGALTHPIQERIASQAAVSLPSVGGRGSSRIQEFNFHNLVSFGSACSEVIGGQEIVGGRTVRITRGSVILERLNVLNTVTADRVVASLVARYSTEKEISFSSEGSSFENLKIGGHSVETQIDHHPFISDESKRIGHCSIVRQVSGIRSSAIQRNHFVIRIPKFGTVSLGELVLNARQRRLNMVRIELKSSYSGAMIAGSISTDGGVRFP